MCLLNKIKQKIKAGDNSKVRQVGKDYHDHSNTYIYYGGASKEEIEKQFLQLFEANFPKLSQQALDSAMKRAEKLISKLLIKLIEKQIPLDILKDPDFQFILIESQKTYARSGEVDIEKILIELLVDRAKNNDASLKKVILNECVSVIPKLAPQQFDVLLLLYLLMDYTFDGVEDERKLANILDKYFIPLIDSVSMENEFYSHLEYAGVCSGGGIAYSGIFNYFNDNYSNAFRPPISTELINEQFGEDKRVFEILKKVGENQYRFNVSTRREIDNLADYLFHDRDFTIKCLTLFKTPNIELEEGNQILTNLNAGMKVLINAFKYTDINTLGLTSVGKEIAKIHFKSKYEILPEN